MMPAALGLPMREIFEQILLEPEIVEAFSSASEPLGMTLALLECFDAEDVAGCDRLLTAFATPGLDRWRLNTFLVESLRWVNGSESA